MTAETTGALAGGAAAPAEVAAPATPAAPAGAAPAPRGAGLRLTLLIGASLTVMSGATIAPGLPGMRAHFEGVPEAELLTRLVLTVPALFIALGAPLAGLVIERVGRLRMLTAGALLYAASGMSGLVLESLPALLVGRALLGLSVAAVMTTVTTLAGDYFAGAERRRFLGLQAAFMGLGGLVFVTGGGFAADLHWRAPFAIYAFALVVPILAAAFLHEPEVRRAPAGSPAERVPRRVGLVLASAFVSMMAFYLVPTQLPFLLVRELGLDAPSLAGLAIGAGTLVSSAASMAYARLGGHLPFGRAVALGWALMAGGFAAVWAATGFGAVMAGMVLTGAGMGAMMPAFSTTMLALVPESRRGRMAGALTAAIFLGQFLSPLVSQPLAGGGLQGVFGVFAAGLAALSALALVGLRQVG